MNLDRHTNTTTDIEWMLKVSEKSSHGVTTFLILNMADNHPAFMTAGHIKIK